jgi:hypothetical protein
MLRKEKVQLIKGLLNGTRSIEELQNKDSYKPLGMVLEYENLPGVYFDNDGKIIQQPKTIPGKRNSPPIITGMIILCPGNPPN